MRAALIGPELEENLALRYLHAAAVAAGHEAKILDFHDEAQISELVKRIVAWQPEVVGLSMVFTARAREYVRLAEALRKAGFGGHITAGGHFASFNAERLITDCPAIDSVLHGEGEQALPNLMARLDRPWETPGITCRDMAGQIVSNPVPPPVDDLDSLPFPTRSSTFYDYIGLPIADVLSGRGCFADCDFCSINAWHRRIGGRRFRQRSVQNLATEMTQLYHRHGVRIFNFHDDNFFLPGERQNVERFTAIRDALLQRGVGRIAIQVKARPDTVEPESMAILKEIGLFRVFLGVESNAVAGLKALGRGIDRDSNHRAVRLLKDMDLHVTFNLLIFEPECSIEDILDNVRFMREQADVPLNFCRTEVYAGTKLESRLRAAGRLEGDYFGYGYTMTDPRSQLVYELFRRVFTPRNFHYDGTNLKAMSLDYHFHLLRRFYPSQAGHGLRQAVKGLIGELNANNADLMERICQFVEEGRSADSRVVGEFGHELSVQREAFDQQIYPRFEGLIAHIRRLPIAGRSRRRGWPGSAVAGVALLATVLNMHCPEMAPCEMAPAPTTPPPPPPATTQPKSSVEPMESVWFVSHATEMAPAGTKRSKDWAMSEMIARPLAETKPAGAKPGMPATSSAPAASRPAGSQPSTQPAVANLSANDVEVVEEFLAMDRNRWLLGGIAEMHGMVGKTVKVDLEMTSSGKVAKLVISLPKDENVQFQRDLGWAIQSWSIPELKKAGRCTVEIKFADPDTVINPETHIFEMAPRDTR
jgi:anaerobic magnesium-protoporphyrin IX monomethyl ester cyclase